MGMLEWTRQMLEFLGGSRDQAPAGFPVPRNPVLWGIWWASLSLVIYVFCGQSSKFIYIDF
jgi:hypothetical protein